MPRDLLAKIPEFPADAKIATRKAGARRAPAARRGRAAASSRGSADLHGSTLNYINAGKDFDADQPRRAATSASASASTAWRRSATASPTTASSVRSGATFLVFADYCRARRSASPRSRSCRSIYIFTHDSVGVGEDGPTHQPVETVSGLRVIPESRRHPPGRSRGNRRRLCRRARAAPTARRCSRSPARPCRFSTTSPSHDPPRRRAQGRLHRHEGNRRRSSPSSSATGSELQHAVAAAKQLGDGIRVVSMPCFERFDRQTAELPRERAAAGRAASASPSRPASPASGGSTSASTARSSASTASASAPRRRRFQGTRHHHRGRRRRRQVSPVFLETARPHRRAVFLEPRDFEPGAVF